VDITKLEKYDSQKMFQIYEKWPEIALEAFDSDQNILKFNEISHIVFAGMGGSGAIGDAFASILSKTKIHISIVKGYVLPNTANSKSLVITTSISGNTEETLEILNAAKKKECKIIAISSGGKMEEFCKKNDIKFCKISKIHSPRASFVKFFYSILKILSAILPITNEEVNESIKKMKEIQQNISSSNLSNSNSALNLAKWITDIPLVYHPWGLNTAAIRFKNSLQENAKLHIMIEDIIETCHNGIVAWEKQSNVQPILLQGQDDNIKTKERYKIIKEYFDENNIKYFEIFSVKGNIISKIINLIYFLDYVSIYKAILLKTDPTPVKSIKYIKNKMN
jgi:glucose/mannose-6-phosphate isomerase|tara:strand:+ start:372 stop:1382 length:1011 start_codon:yes stop_codon:yes gene_type:complete